MQATCRPRAMSSTIWRFPDAEEPRMTAAPSESPRWPALQRAHKAIVIVDVVESVRLMQFHEADVVDRWTRFVQEVQGGLLPRRGGRLVKSLGDGMLLEFESAPSAAAAALELQERIGRFNENRPSTAHIELRIGIHVDDVIVDALDVYGAGVNLAARLSALANPGEVAVSTEVRDQLVPGVDGDIEDLGDCYLKHIAEPIRAFRLGQARRSSAAGLLAPADAIRPGIAVMPFECLVGNDPTDVFGEALADELNSRLARSAELHVISGLSTRSLRRRRMSLAELGTMLGAAYVLTGRYRVAVDAIALNVELAESRSGRVLWASAFDTSFQQAFAPDSSLAAAVVAATSQAILRSQLERVDQEPLHSLEAFTLLLAAISLMHRNSRSAFERSRLLLEHLAERQGRRGIARAWLAKWHVLSTVQGWTSDPTVEGTRALEHVQRSLDANPSNGLALAIGGLVHGYLRKDLATAGKLYDEALLANPNESLAWLFSATRHAYLGHGPEAAAASDRALRLSPLDPIRYFFLSLSSVAMLADSNAARAVELARESLRANRTHASTWRTLVYALVMQGDTEAARAAARELLAIEPQLTVESFLRRFPGSEGPMAQPWSSALRESGVPDH